jgi:hypothetical protein
VEPLIFQTKELKQAFTEYVAYLWGFFSILFVTTCIGVRLTKLVDFADVEFKNGMIVFWTMPATVSSSVVLTQQVLVFFCSFFDDDKGWWELHSGSADDTCDEFVGSLHHTADAFLAWRLWGRRWRYETPFSFFLTHQKSSWMSFRSLLSLWRRFLFR